ncbi:tail fiber protein [uncultured Polaribacter sp.]|uniref:phage tail protein n=1 Tax=uncultured Polaribacter sp. TaxID=174711 RepID=UPI00262BCC0B|nr:tail fiber protein [uncultured Polaribacter sp.]
MKTLSTKIGFLILFIFFSTIKINAQSDPLLGEVKLFAGNFAPRGWALCQGQILPISSNEALFSILGTTYGGDGRTTFALPDLRGRVAVGVGNGPGLQTTNRIGDRGGVDRQVLNTLNLPQHNHVATTTITNSANVISTDNAVNTTPVTGDVPAVANFGPGLSTTTVKSYGPATNTVTSQTSSASTQIGFTGNSQAFENRPPFLVINYIIALQGTFPSRN